MRRSYSDPEGKERAVGERSASTREGLQLAVSSDTALSLSMIVRNQTLRG